MTDSGFFWLVTGYELGLAQAAMLGGNATVAGICVAAAGLMASIAWGLRNDNGWVHRADRGA